MKLATYTLTKQYSAASLQRHIGNRQVWRGWLLHSMIVESRVAFQSTFFFFWGQPC